MKNPLKFVAAFLAAVCLTAAALAAEASPAGTWTWTVQGRQGGQSFEQTLKLEMKDGKVSGTMLGRDFGQFTIPDTPIADATLKDGVLKFSVTRQFNDRSFTSKYEGKIDGDTIKGTTERPGFNGGEPTKSEWVAKRAK